MIENEQQLQTTRAKLERLKAHLAERRREPSSHARDLSLESLQQTLIELEEEIDQYETLQSEPRATGTP